MTLSLKKTPIPNHPSSVEDLDPPDPYHFSGFATLLWWLRIGVCFYRQCHEIFFLNFLCSKGYSWAPHEQAKTANFFVFYCLVIICADFFMKIF